MNIEKSANYLADIDPKMGELIKKIGLIELPVPQSNFESLVDSIISQQVSVQAAATIRQRIYEAMDYDIRPERMLKTPSEVFRIAGLSRQKTSYMAALAEAFMQNPHAYNNLHERTNEDVVKLLTEIKGIGVWTSQMFMMFNLLREDIFPVGDLGVRRAVEKHYFQGEKQEHEILIQKAEIWMPHRTVASFYLWRSLKIKN